MRNFYWFSMSLLTCLAVLSLLFAPPKQARPQRGSFCKDWPMEFYLEIDMTERELFNVLEYLDKQCFGINLGCAFVAHVKADGIVDFGCESALFFIEEDQ